MAVKLEHLLTEAVNSRTVGIDAMDTQEVLRIINDEDKTVADAVAREIPRIAAAVETIVAAFQNGGRLIYIGAGTSGRLGVLDAAECPPTFGLNPGQVIGLIAGGETALVQAVEGSEDQSEGAIPQLAALTLTDKDVVVGLAASGRTPYVIGGLAYANERGAFTVAISCTPEPAVGQVAKLAITPLVGPEVIAGSTRMKAGTAQKMVLNMLSTAAMIRLGKVYGNLMVDVQATNAKLVERAERIVAAATGISREEAGEFLAAAGLHPKTAIVMIKRQCSAGEAARYLAAAGGYVARALSIDEKELKA
ncbi:N-acetylmuramic acid 6-phosphate etherase [Sporomusa aerivorans]|uniref:N-acetylmuramic acid 6-phosphate etherase n=1 Tax=Sporomusa aerivorans TaxID=204936 RepID=UPI003529D72D